MANNKRKLLIQILISLVCMDIIVDALGNKVMINQAIFHCGQDHGGITADCSESHRLLLKQVTYVIDQPRSQCNDNTNCTKTVDMTNSARQHCYTDGNPISSCCIDVNSSECDGIRPAQPWESKDELKERMPTFTLTVIFICEHDPELKEPEKPHEGSGGHPPSGSETEVGSGAGPGKSSDKNTETGEKEKKKTFLFIVVGVIGVTFIVILILSIAVCVLCKRSAARGQTGEEVSVGRGPFRSTIKRTPSEANQYMMVKPAGVKPTLSNSSTVTYEEIPNLRLEAVPASPTTMNPVGLKNTDQTSIDKDTEHLLGQTDDNNCPTALNECVSNKTPSGRTTWKSRGIHVAPPRGDHVDIWWILQIKFT